MRSSVFDIRNVIAALLGIYGVVLVGTGVVDRSAQALAKAGMNIDAWTGAALLVVASALAVWSSLRPSGVAATEVHERLSGSD